MALVVSVVGNGFAKPSTMASMRESRRRERFGAQISHLEGRKTALVVRAEGVAVNPEIRKNEDKVVDTVVVTELSKPVTAYCRCWRSATFPACDGSHVKHNKATGDNVGPLLLKKQ
ncbi:hypothetical protein Nepgr_021551 [Nepenthes gracilis]|uniref:Iron-binding zinc finger CDGSH type domain-containing protein n=1 Tax=Nepenthes gracilis TaxID=150966 RepID=A0AAD3XXB4_NEPGR|nr:hypothetical protein Nepgr_021551 [Nepenthes gracilis]